MDFANRLKELRKKKGFSQNELADTIGVHFTQISRYERGETKPNAGAMAKLAHALDTTVDFLMIGTSDDLIESVGLEKEIISRLKQIQEFGKEDKKTALYLLDALIAKNKIQSLYTY